jgi:hypothetical protein
MAFTTTDLAAIDAAIASGELTVRTADGKQVTLRQIRRGSEPGQSDSGH